MRFKREIIFSYSADVLFEYPPYFKIHRCPENFPKPPTLIGHYPYFIDFQTKKIENLKGVTNYSFKLDEKPIIDKFKKIQFQISLLNQISITKSKMSI